MNGALEQNENSCATQSVKLPVLVPAVLVPRYNFLYRYGYRKELYFKKYCIVPVPERLKAKVPEDFSYKILPVLRFFGEKRPFWPQNVFRGHGSII